MSAVNPRHAAVLFQTIAEIEGSLGPITEKYAVPLEYPRLYQWVPLDSSTVDHLTVLGHSGGGVGTWKLVRSNDRGVDLGNANAPINVSGKPWRVLPDATLTGDVTYTLSTTGAVAGDRLDITRLDTTAHVVSIVNGGTGAGTTTMPSGSASFAMFHFNGSDWIVRASGTML